MNDNNNDNQKQALGGIYIPPETRIAPISWSAKALFGILLQFPKFKTTGLKISRKKLSAILGCSTRTISRHLEDLEKHHFILRQKEKFFKNKYQMSIKINIAYKEIYAEKINTISPLPKMSTHIAKNVNPYCQKCQPYKDSTNSHSKKSSDGNFLFHKKFSKNVFENSETEKNKKTNSIIDEILGIWNKEKNTTKHRKNSNTTKFILKYIKQLQLGIFFKNNEIAHEWILKNSIPESYSRKKWTRDEIIATIKNLALLSNPKYLTNGQNPSFYKNLSNLIYNPRKKISFFLAVSISPPKIKKYSEDLLNKHIKEIKREIFYDYDFTESENETLKAGLTSIFNFIKNIKYDKYDRIRAAIGTNARVVSSYLEYLHYATWIKDFTPSIFNINHAIFKKFISNLENELDLEIKAE